MFRKKLFGAFKLKELLKKQFAWVLSLASGKSDENGIVEIKIEGPLVPGSTEDMYADAWVPNGLPAGQLRLATLTIEAQ